MVVGLAMNSAVRKLNNNKFKKKTSTALSDIATTTIAKIMTDTNSMLKLQNFISASGTKTAGSMLMDPQVRMGLALTMKNAVKNQNLAKAIANKNGVFSAATRTAIRTAAAEARKEAVKTLAMVAGVYGMYRIGKSLGTRYMFAKKK